MNYQIDGQYLTDIADAIRAKTGGVASITPEDMPDEIASISGGSTLVTKTINQNGTYDPQDDNADGYSEVTVYVSGGGSTLTGTSVPSSSLGSDGDYYYQYVADYDYPTTTFEYTGNVQTFVAPTTGTYGLKAYGARGGNAKSTGNNTAYGGLGGYAYGEISLTTGDTLYIVVGGEGGDDIASATSYAGGYNGGGSAYAYEARAARASGGGASHVALRTGLLASLENYQSDILIVAGGGGGASQFNNIIGSGGTGGGTTGGDGDGSDGTKGTGGTQSAGGTGSTPGAFGQGGDRAHSGYGGAGGGGGYYGGGCGYNNMGAGGGSGYLSASLSNSFMEDGVNDGEGIIKILNKASSVIENRTVIHTYYKINGNWSLMS